MVSAETLTDALIEKEVLNAPEIEAMIGKRVVGEHAHDKNGSHRAAQLPSTATPGSDAVDFPGSSIEL